jgi:acyl carrier protein
VEEQRFTFGDLKNILVNRVGVPEPLVTDNPNLTFEDLGLDSLAIVELQLAIQQKYGIAIADHETVHIKTLGGSLDFTNRRIAEKEAQDASPH